MKKNALKFFLMAGLIIIVFSACSSKADTKKTEPAKAEAPMGLPVDALVANETTIDQSEVVAGSIVPNRSVEIMSELSKKVSLVAFKDGDYVKQGQLLYKLEDADIQAKLRQLQAELNLARINENRLHELLKTETVRREEYDVALAKLQSLQAAQEYLLVELAKSSIRAPFSGVIGISRAFAGALVTPGTALVSLQEQSSVKIQFTVSEKYSPLMKPGTRIQFTTELNTGIQSATIVSTEAGVDQQSRSITVQAAIPNKDGKLKPGISAKVHFKTTTENAKGILVPTDALIPGGNGYSVFLVKNSTARITPVTIVNRNEKSALIGSGINSGDTVMISNMLRAADGTPVSIVGIK
jgi:membrane fusion protein (multidrug efflux system)